MSSDLSAAFGEATPPPRPPPPPPPPKAAVNREFNGPSTRDMAADIAPSAPPQATQDSIQPTAGVNSLKGEGEDDEDDEDDDFGDFEDASAAPELADITPATADPSPISAPMPVSAPPSAAPFPPRAQTRPADPEPEQVIGRHPFANHMDFLFSGGDDEYDAGADDLEDLSRNPAAAMEYSKRLIAAQEAQATKKPLPFAKPSTPVANPPTAAKKLQKQSGDIPAQDPNVLFNVENGSEQGTEDDDDFGDFEVAPATTSVTASASPPPALKIPQAKLQTKSGHPPRRAQAAPAKPRMAQIDLLGLGDEVAVPNILSPRSERASSILGHAKADSMSRPKSSSLLPKQEEEEDVWDDFDIADPVSAPSLVPSSSYRSSRNTSAAGPTPASTVSMTSNTNPTTQDDLPPTNVPPPAILLSAFTSIFSNAHDALFSPLSKLDAPQRSQLLAHPATHQFLASYLQSAIVLAHIIAGRKLRWKRDQMLAQSMRIGPAAAAGGRGGMKLTSIDKSEAGKEDREVLETVQRWKSQLGKLKAAVTAAAAASSSTSQTSPEKKNNNNNNNNNKKLPTIPEIAETMPIRTLKPSEGGFVAPHACALCGLKREERVLKVDGDVHDSFGEWWSDGARMHVFCLGWWGENKGGKVPGR